MKELYKIQAKHVDLQLAMQEDPNERSATELAYFREIFKEQLSEYEAHWKSKRIVLNEFFRPNVDQWMKQGWYTRLQLLNKLGLNNEAHAQEVLIACSSQSL